MNRSQDFPETPASSETLEYDLPASLPRTISISDFSKLFTKDQASSRSESHAESRRFEKNGSENSQILYMAGPKRSRNSKTRQSLSSIGNNSDRRFDGTSDDKHDECAAEDVSWNIIDQEIYEWQYVCQSGRPYWWSPESKYARLKRFRPRLTNDPINGFWMRELGCPKPAFAEKRRAVSDNYFCDPNTVHDLAHLVAVQLLGACFTLPPDHILGMPSPNYALDKDASVRLPDPRMISSLRMHTQFRYSPSFGHQARNTSPVQAWPRTYGASAPGFSSPIVGIGASSAAWRSKRRRTVNTSDGSGPRSSLDSDGDRGHPARSCSSNDSLDRIMESSGWHQSRGTGRYDESHISVKVPHLRHPRIQVDKRRTQQRSSRGEEWTLAYPEAASTSQPKSNYRLEPVICSEPHHVFVQPVRELVVKRWTNFKRRLSGSLHSALPTRASEDQESEYGSPAMSSDAKTRRLRAQERGEIHSSDVDSAPHYNTSASGNVSPNSSGLGTPHRIDLSSAPAFRLSNPSIAEAALAAAERRVAAASKEQPFSRRRKRASPSESSINPIRQPNFARMPPLTTLPGPAFPLYSPARFATAVAASTSNSFSSRRKPNREKRKSMLSEMYTPSEVQDSETPSLEGNLEPGIFALSAPTSAAVSPKETIPNLTSSSRLQERYPISSSASFFSPNSRRSQIHEGPNLERTSTSGTQIFIPGDDGIELDGLPVGPPQYLWIGKARRERTYL